MRLEEIASQFIVEGNVESVVPYGTGNINSTYLATFVSDRGNKVKVLLQMIKTSVFPNPFLLMRNISNVTDHIRREIQSEGKEDFVTTLNLVKTKDGKLLFVDRENPDNILYWRAYEFVEDTIALDKANSTDELYTAFKAYGMFDRFLLNYPINEIEVILPNFHNTPEVFMALKKAVKDDLVGRVNLVQDEIDWFLSKYTEICWLQDYLMLGVIPRRITHNDPKLSNVLLGDKVCVIDLDTVQLGAVGYDLGDGIRSGSSNAEEDDTNLENVYIREDFFRAIISGYFSEMGQFLTEEEVEYTVDYAALVTLELSIRFLTDYINGDSYFNIRRPDHNLERARNQRRLYEDIILRRPVLERIVKEEYAKVNL